MSRPGNQPRTGTVSGLFYYPVKSLAGISVDHADLTAMGIPGDRMWMLVSESGRFITQREEHRLALLNTAADDDGFVISAPSGEETRLPFRCHPHELTTVRVWKDEVSAAVGPPDARAFFSSYLGYPCRPVYMPDRTARQAGRYAPDRTPLSFADAYPGLLTSEASLEDLNSRASIHLVMNRFRPNIVISHTLPYDEDSWSRLTLGSAEIACVKPCSRCVVTSVDPETGTSWTEPLRTLAGYRRIDNDVYFGQNFVVSRAGSVRVGDRITIVDRKEPLFPPAR